MQNIFGEMISKHNPSIVYPIKWSPSTGDIRISINNTVSWKLIAENVFNENYVLAVLEITVKKTPHLFNAEFIYRRHTSHSKKEAA